MRLRKIYTGIAILMLVIVGSTLGYQSAGWGFVDSLYMVVITVFGVGFGEVHPLSAGQKVFTMFVIVTGSSAVVYIVGNFIRIVTEGEIQRMFGNMKKSRTIEDITGHAIICGYGRIGQILAQELAASAYPFIVVDNDPDRIAMAEASGYLCVKGSATEEEALTAAGVQRAKVLATVLPQDTLNVFITLTARNLNRALRIIARGEQPATEKKLRQAGADEVVLPAAIGGHRIANGITRASVMHFMGDAKGLLNHDLNYLGLEVDELTIRHDASLKGQTVAQIQEKMKTAMIVLAVRLSDGRILKGGFDEHPLDEGDSLVVIGRHGSVAKGLAKDDVSRNELL